MSSGSTFRKLTETELERQPEEVFDLVEEIGKEGYWWLELGPSKFCLKKTFDFDRNFNFFKLLLDLFYSLKVHLESSENDPKVHKEDFNQSRRYFWDSIFREFLPLFQSW